MNKLLYKVELCLVKVIPMIYALLSLLNTTLSYFSIDVVILSYIGSVSLVTLLFLYVTSYVFKFCEYHRMFIHYTTVTWILNIIDLNVNKIRVRDNLILSFCLYCKYFIYISKEIYLLYCRYAKLCLTLHCFKNKKVEEYGRRVKLR